MSTAIRLIAVITTGLYTGILLGDRIGVSPVRPTLPASCFVKYQQGLHVRFAKLMPALLFPSALANALLAWLMWRTGEIAAFCFGLSALLIFAVIAMTITFNVPINNLLMTWNPDNPPADWWNSWHPWERVHTVRTTLSVIAFVIQTIGTSIL